MLARGSLLLGLLLGVGLLDVSTAIPKEARLEPLARPEAGIAITPVSQPPLAVEGTDAAGRPLFASPAGASLFLAVDVRALKGNRNGFGAGEFVPYLSIAYRARRQDGGETAQGRLHPLVTRDGMRYGNNVRLPGPGAYTITLTIDPPVKVGFGRHTDLETGVARWWSTMQVEWTLKHSAPSGSR
ncbi:MAG: hypothetical protein A2W08_02525 [Candidatus Rokubacteria bacterium RBG_16_73_20]|nr:MAG: hypothetical protein A2050_10100 [Candidatus Rokubacteria bacterium GWA2_73_35]OGK87265.1 MAG: hypothetical protein A2X52_10900 [Candidatus Rokubacteria bacterium GWC2_70_16]OGK97499.1 MAG: hypothetical protein A2W08_02525 [Candidatus Rokubacteria bacterium RBG_16_73_20]